MRALLAVPAALLALAAPAAAETTTIGPKLEGKTATLAVANPNDWSAWNTKVADGSGQAAVPVNGELNAVRLMGLALQDYRAPVSARIQVLRPQADGRVQTVVTSEDLPLPTSGAPDQISRFGREVLNLPTSRMCVKRGDYVAFFLNGGAEVRREGVQAQVFARAPGAAYDLFKSPVAGQAGTFAGRTQSDQELLLQAEIGTGADARPFCGGTEGIPTGGGGGGTGGGSPTPTEPAGPATLRVGRVKGKPVVRRNRFALGVVCAAAAPCRGRLSIVRGSKTLGARAVSVPANGALRVVIALNRLGRKLFRRQGFTLNVTARATQGGRTHERDIRIVKRGLN